MARIGDTHNGNGTMWGDGVCTVCGSNQFLDILDIKGIPAQDGVLWPTQAEALNAPKGDITLSLCLNCSYVGNRKFDPNLLKFFGYNVSLEHSPLYQKFIKSLASGLIERYNLRDKTVLEIGCGNGFFLKTICALGGNKGIGFDPSYTDIDGSGAKTQTIQFVKDFYSDRYAEYAGDLVCCRQVLDHLGSPKAFLKMVRGLIGDRTDSVVYFEVPNPERRLQQFVPWNVGYEHGSWLFPNAFRLLFELSGFAVKQVSPCHNGDYLGIEAVPVAQVEVTELAGARAEIDQLADDLKTLSDRFKAAISTWEAKLQQIERDGIRAIPWGAGERGIGFLSILNIKQLMPYIVDINPGRVGKYLPGTGQKVVPPEFIVEYKPDVVIITNPTYQTEIQEHVKKLGINCEFLIP